MPTDLRLLAFLGVRRGCPALLAYVDLKPVRAKIARCRRMPRGRLDLLAPT